MSHVTKIDVVINNLDALAEACQELGGELLLGVTEYKEYYSKKKCTHCIRFKGASYEIGVQAQKDGTFILEADFWSSGGLTGKVGTGGTKLQQQYKCSAVKSEMKKKGFKVTKSWEQDGNIQMEFEKARKSY